jgi:hypothetical protein
VDVTVIDLTTPSLPGNNIQPSCLVATASVELNMPSAGVWDITATPVVGNPVKVTTNKLTTNPFTYLFAGENRSAGLTSTGWLYCWGRNIGSSPVLTDKNVQNVYLITDIGIIYIKNRQYYVAYPTDILSNLSNPIPSIIPYDKSSLPLTTGISSAPDTRI